MTRKGAGQAKRTDAAAEWERAAATARRLAVLLGAGLAPPLAVRHAHADPERADGPWAALAASWSVAVAFGAPLAATLNRVAAGLDASAGLRRELDVAFAGPAATAKLVGMLPLVGLLLGMLLGVGSLHVLFATPIGWACLAVGLGLMAAARRWSAAMIRAATPRGSAPGLGVELVAVALSAGVSVPRARGAASAELERRLPERDPLERAAEEVTLDEVLELATAAGVPAVVLLRAEGDRMRSDAASRGRQAAAAVAVRLMLPLALCVLPAFMLLGVAPVLIALFSSSGLLGP